MLGITRWLTVYWQEDVCKPYASTVSIYVRGLHMLCFGFLEEILELTWRDKLIVSQGRQRYLPIKHIIWCKGKLRNRTTLSKQTSADQMIAFKQQKASYCVGGDTCNTLIWQKISEHCMNQSEKKTGNPAEEQAKLDMHSQERTSKSFWQEKNRT